MHRNYKKIIKLKKWLVFFLVVILNAINFSLAHANSLVAITINTVKGTEPYLLFPDEKTKINNSDQLKGFLMWDGTYNSSGSKNMVQVDATMSNNLFKIPNGMTYNDIITLIPPDGSLHDLTGTKVGNDDGDAANPQNTNVTGQMSATWFKNGVQVAANELNQTLSACGGPYTLKVDVPTEVTANTTYGDPNSKLYGKHAAITYAFLESNLTPCYLKPQSMTTYTGTEGQTIKFANGYNSKTWEPDKGFKANSPFPETGFYKAQFDLILPGSDQSVYRCTSTDNGGKITLSGAASTTLGQNCSITYNVQRKSEFIAGGKTPTIDLEYNINGNWEKVGSYTIPTPKKWAISTGLMKFADSAYLSNSKTFPVLDACRLVVDGSNSPATTLEQVQDMSEAGKAWKQKYLYKRNELTNSPLTKYDELSQAPVPVTYFSRDADGTFMGEWGTLPDYTGSNWDATAYMWQIEFWSTYWVFVVGKHGGISYSSLELLRSTPCRGD